MTLSIYSMIYNYILYMSMSFGLCLCSRICFFPDHDCTCNYSIYDIYIHDISVFLGLATIASCDPYPSSPSSPSFISKVLELMGAEMWKDRLHQTAAMDAMDAMDGQLGNARTKCRLFCWKIM